MWCDAYSLLVGFRVMQTNQGGHLSDADRADTAVTAYLTATAAVRRLEEELAYARAVADVSAAAMDVAVGETRGRLGRLARELGVEEQSLGNQRSRGRNRPAPKEPALRMLTDAEYDAAFSRADTEARHKVPGTTLAAIVSGVLATVGILAPPPEPDDDTCTAQAPDPDGEWWQCQREPHDDGRHDAGDLAWTDDLPNAVPARPCP